MAKTYYVLDGPRKNVLKKGSYNECMDFVKTQDLNYELGLSGPMDENNRNKIMSCNRKKDA